VSAALLSSALVVALSLCVRAAHRSRARLAAAGRVGERRRWRPRLLTAPAWLAARWASVAPEVAVDRAWTAWVVAAGIGLAGGLVVGAPVLAAVVAALLVGAPRACESSLRRRSLQRAGAAVPTVLEGMARSVRSGATLHQAVMDAADAPGSPVVGAAFAEVVAATARGQPLVDALEMRRADDGGVPGLRLAFTALAVAAESGGPQAVALDGVAATLRQRLSGQAEAAALGSQARLSAAVIALAPIAFTALSVSADHQQAAFLFRTPVGLGLLVVGLALDALGAWWMARPAG
jgi:tight adherence protein B